MNPKRQDARASPRTDPRIRPGRPGPIPAIKRNSVRHSGGGAAASGQTWLSYRSESRGALLNTRRAPSAATAQKPARHRIARRTPPGWTGAAATSPRIAATPISCLEQKAIPARAPAAYSRRRDPSESNRTRSSAASPKQRACAAAGEYG